MDLPAGGGISCLLLLPCTSQLASLVVGYLAHPYFRRLPGTGRWSRCAAVLFGGFLAVRLARRLTFKGLTARDSWLAIFCLSGVCLNGRCPGAWERAGPLCRARSCSKATLGRCVGHTLAFICPMEWSSGGPDCLADRRVPHCWPVLGSPPLGASRPIALAAWDLLCVRLCDAFAGRANRRQRVHTCSLFHIGHV